MTMPVAAGPSGIARNAANLFPSAASSVRSSCETAAPAIRGIGGSESTSKHIPGAYGRSGGARDVDIPAMAKQSHEQSHREEMSAAIRAQRERQAVPKTIAPDPPPAPDPPKTLLDRLRGK